MSGTVANLRLYTGEAAVADLPDPPPPADPAPLPDPVVLAGRELIRPPSYLPTRHARDPFSPAWFDELDRKRYARHGSWLPKALEFGRHPGEAVLLLNPGVGTDAVAYLRHGSEPTVAAGPADHPDLIRANLARAGHPVRVVLTDGPDLPFADGAFDVAVLNGLDGPSPSPAELLRVLKAGGKLIGLFPARYDAGYWQDLFLPLQHLYWRRPADSSTGPRWSAAGLRRHFAGFVAHRVKKRHLRRGELPHLWRVLPLAVLERLVGRVLVLKAFKPLPALKLATAVHRPLAA
ncbi:MAG: methyltransferase domain-containing protein [Gemmataceae bacterium]|nr:methyltransferase domain-containing protein [Gemmataceae bacterium]